MKKSEAKEMLDVIDRTELVNKVREITSEDGGECDFYGEDADELLDWIAGQIADEPDDV